MYMTSSHVSTLQNLLDSGSAYIRDGHVLCYANSAPSVSHDFSISPHLKVNESDVLMWKPHTAIGLKAKDCVMSPWGAGLPTCNLR